MKLLMKRLRKEIIVDIAWVVFSAGYISTATQYPPAGRLIPMTVGIAALVIGLFQLSGNIFPVLRRFTHDKEVSKDQAEESMSPDSLNASNVAWLRQWIAIGWAAGLVLGIYVLGYIITIPVFFLAYFLVQKNQRNWKLAIISAVVMGALTFGVFDVLLGLHLYTGLLGQFFGY